MVNGTIDIHKLNFEELSGVVGMYPWYGAARMELCSRMHSMDALSDSQIAQAALYIGSRKILHRMLKSDSRPDYSDKDAHRIADAMIAPQAATEKKVYVVGGDYFSKSQYENVRTSEDGIFSRFAAKARADMDDSFTKDIADEQETDFCTETLAQIYLEQGYPDKAAEIYSKLILRYPEKSIYFASLIDEINKNKE